MAPTKPGPGFSACALSDSIRYCAELTVNGPYQSYSRMDCHLSHPFVEMPYDAGDAHIMCCKLVTSTEPALIAVRSKAYIGSGTFSDMDIDYVVGIFPNSLVNNDALIIAAELEPSCTLDGAPPAEPEMDTYGDRISEDMQLTCAMVLSNGVKVAGIGRARVVANVMYGTVCALVIRVAIGAARSAALASSSAPARLWMLNWTHSTPTSPYRRRGWSDCRRRWPT